VSEQCGVFISGVYQCSGAAEQRSAIPAPAPAARPASSAASCSAVLSLAPLLPQLPLNPPACPSSATGMLCAMMATGIWLIIATYWELPVSTTHSIVGAIIGMTMVSAGPSAVIWSSCVGHRGGRTDECKGSRAGEGRACWACLLLATAAEPPPSLLPSSALPPPTPPHSSKDTFPYIGVRAAERERAFGSVCRGGGKCARASARPR
jgi:hypothetical protein